MLIQMLEHMDLEQLLDTLYPVHDCNLEHFDLLTSP